MAKSKSSKHGGPRPGSGVEPKDPAAGTRKMWSGRLHPDTVRTIKLCATPGLSQAEVVDIAVEYWREKYLAIDARK